MFTQYQVAFRAETKNYPVKYEHLCICSVTTQVWVVLLF